MNKADLIDAIASKTGGTKVQAAVYLEAVTSVLTDTLRHGGTVSLMGFGAFSIKSRKARTGRNPQNGEPVEIAAKNLPVFKAGKTLVDAVN